MAIEYRDGMHRRMICKDCGCMVSGTIRQWGIKWIWEKNCGHEARFCGYILPVDELYAKGWATKMSDMPEDPRISAKKRGQAWDEYISQQEWLEYTKRKGIEGTPKPLAHGKTS